MCPEKLLEIVLDEIPWLKDCGKKIFAKLNLQINYTCREYDTLDRCFTYFRLNYSKKTFRTLISSFLAVPSCKVLSKINFSKLANIKCVYIPFLVNLFKAWSRCDGQYLKVDRIYRVAIDIP